MHLMMRMHPDIYTFASVAQESPRASIGQEDDNKTCGSRETSYVKRRDKDASTGANLEWKLGYQLTLR
jgi:hypothetical protein